MSTGNTEGGWWLHGLRSALNCSQGGIMSALTYPTSPKDGVKEEPDVHFYSVPTPD